MAGDGNTDVTHKPGSGPAVSSISSGAAEQLDCLIVGGGPAGLTAAIYLARFRRKVAVVDAGAARCAWIPRSHNLPGFPNGMPGTELLLRMRAQAVKFGAVLHHGAVRNLRRGDDGDFLAHDGDAMRWRTPHVLLATGVIDLEPRLPDLFDAVRRGLVRHCPICDGWEARDQRIAVLGEGAHGAREAEFLRTWSEDVTLLTNAGDPPLDGATRDGLACAGVAVDERPIAAVRVEADRIVAIRMADGADLVFDTLYSAMGAVPRGDLARQVRAAVAEDGRLVTDAHQRTSVPGLYAAGDLVSGLNQICVAQSQAAQAATAIHNALRTAWSGRRTAR